MKNTLIRRDAGRGMKPAARNFWEAGLTLVELMIALALGMLVVSAAMMLLLSTKSSFTVEDDAVRLLDTGKFAMDNVTRSVRLTAYENLEGNDAAVDAAAATTSNVTGLDNRTFGSIPATGLPTTATMTKHHSDILKLRFFGNSLPNGDPDGTVVNCAGVSIGKVATAAEAENGRGWSIYYVRDDASGEPELHCGYLDTANEFHTTVLARDVESFQVLYGLDTDGDNIPNRFLNATDVAALGAQKWDNVVAIKIAMLVRGGPVSRADNADSVYDLFGPGYTDSSDSGTQIDEASASMATERNRSRKLFTTFIQLRNRASGANIGAVQ